MNIGKAVAICENLDSEKYSLEEKAFAIREVMNMPTHMGVRKDTLIGMIKWLWNFNLEVSESHNGKRIVAIPTPHGRLIDADAHIQSLKENQCGERCRKNHDCVNCGIGMYIRIVENEPTVIEAEE
jgi:hypothetical protein